MLAALALMIVDSDPREALVEGLWKADQSQFFSVKERFGASRIEFAQPVGKTHLVTGRSMSPEFVTDRFLVGNKTAKFGPHSMRTTYVPIGPSRRPNEKPAPEFPQKDVEPEVRRSFGTDFKWWTKANRWVVVGKPLRAKEECLSCHRQAKLDDPLGYLVYAVGDKVKPPTRQ